MKIGIAVSVTVLVIAAMAGTFIFWKRKANKGNVRFNILDHDNSINELNHQH